MLTNENAQTSISVPVALRLVGVVTGVWAIIYVLGATLTYIPGHPDFSLFTTYLSDIGDTAGWPQILFNSGTLVAAPLRYLVLVLIVLRLTQMGAGRAFAISTLVIGFISTAGTVLMTATPISVAPAVHKSGIALYFLGVVVLQTVVFFKQWAMKEVLKILPVLSLIVVVVFLVFLSALVLYMQGTIGRGLSVVFEWLCFASSVVWLFAQSILLGRVGVALEHVLRHT
jgi:hypothetical protein